MSLNFASPKRPKRASGVLALCMKREKKNRPLHTHYTSHAYTSHTESTYADMHKTNF